MARLSPALRPGTPVASRRTRGRTGFPRLRAPCSRTLASVSAGLARPPPHAQPPSPRPLARTTHAALGAGCCAAILLWTVFSPESLSCCRSWQGDGWLTRRGDHNGRQGECRAGRRVLRPWGRGVVGSWGRARGAVCPSAPRAPRLPARVLLVPAESSQNRV